MTPLETIYSDALNCMWEAPKYFFFSSEVDSLVYYSHLFPGIASAILMMLLLLAKPKNISVIILTYISGLFFLYSLVDLLLWSTTNPSLVMFFWSSLIQIELIIYTGVAYLVLTYTRQRDISFSSKLLLGLVLLPLFLLGPTALNLLGFDYTNCDRLAVEGPFSLYLYLFEILCIIIIIVQLFAAQRDTLVENTRKKAIAYIGIGSIFLLISLSLGNIIGTLFQSSIGENSWVYAQYGFFGMPVFLGFIMYVIVRFKAFNTKMIGAQALVLSLWVLIGSLLFVAQSVQTRIVAGVTLILVTVFGYILVRSVKREITQKEEIEKLATNLQSANEKLKVLDKMKSEFVSIASHQLRSPLTSIRGYASMLAEGSYGKLTQKAQEVAERIAESSKFMALSVEDYLNVSRIEAGNMKYEMSDFNLKEVAEKIVDELRVSALKKGLVIVFRSDCNGSCSTHADIGKTRQVISNIIDNSMKYTPKGSITVVVHDDPSKKKIYVTVQDTGVGMSKETQDEVFEKFVRAKNANNVNVTGTGLGLFVAKKMLTDMGGKVWAESEGEGKGSTFHIELPLLPGKPSAR